MYSWARGVARGGRLSACLVLCLLGWLPSCRSQDELRSIDLPYPRSYNLDQITGAYVSYGLSGELTDGKMYYPLAQQDGKLFVGARDELFSVNPVNFELIRSVSIPSSGTPGGCTDYCSNFVRLIEPLSDGDLLVCGTNSAAPICQHRSPNTFTVTNNMTDLTDVTLPFLPHQNFSCLMLNETVFVGAYHGITSGSDLRIPVISRYNLATTEISLSLQTLREADVLHRHTAQFVGDPVEYNGRIYFFFRETATEYTAEDITYSRVGMVCKNDTGGKMSASYGPNHMVTFVKARLNCAIGGTLAYEYNEIQDTYQSTVNKMVVFAIFATKSPEPASSAVCAYRLDDIEALFTTKSNFVNFKDNEADPFTPRQATCPDTTSYSDPNYADILAMGQLMSDLVENKLLYEAEATSTTINPLLVSYGERFSQIVVDDDVVNSLDVMFIGTEKGTVLKAYLTEDRTEARVVEEIRLNANIKTPVLAMLKSEADQAVFVGTNIGVYKIPFQHCQDYATEQDCLDAKDPYCRWNTTDCVHTDGEQDLVNGSGIEPVGTIDILSYPQSRRIALNINDQPIFFYLLANATGGTNLGVRGGEIPCPPCASLPFNASTFVSSGTEFLALYIDGSSSSGENLNCSCSCVLEIDGGVTATANFTLTVDDSRAAPEFTDELDNFDNEILEYKTKLQSWLEELGRQFNLTNVQICPVSGCQ